MIGTIDIAVRTAGCSLLLLMGGLLLRDARAVRPGRFGALLAAGLTGVLVVDTPNSLELPALLRATILLFSMNAAIFIWWFLRALLDDEFRLGRIEWAVAAAWFLLGVPNYLAFANSLPIVNAVAANGRALIAIGIALHVLQVALAGRGADLVEERRRVRVGLAVAIIVIFAVDIGTEYLFGYLNTPLWYSAAEAALYLLIIVWTYFWLIQIDRSALMFERAPPPGAPEAPTLSPREQMIRRKLQQAIETDRAFLDPGLTIGKLAEMVGTPEHQLRALINIAMGHRNFRSYLNEYRLAAVRRDLADPEKAALPILTISIDAGFASLSSFNRVFKESTGSTPSEWRAAALKAVPTDQN
jgi:AraC-like DNA-binding protein